MKRPVDLNLVVGRDGKMMQVLQQGIDEKASRNREMNQSLSKRMQDRMDFENENMFPERKHEQVKDKKQTSAPVMFNKKGNNKRSQKAESMDIDNSETIVEEEEVYEVENVYENIPSSKNKNKKKQFDRAKVNEAVEKVLKQQSPVKSDSSSEDSSSSSSDSETDVQKNKNELSDDGSSKRKKKKKNKKNKNKKSKKIKKKKKQKKQHMSEDEVMEVEHQQNKNEEKAQQSDDFSDYEDYKKYKSQKPKDDVNDPLNRKLPEKMKKSQLRQFIKRRAEEGQINLFNHISVVVREVKNKEKATVEDKFISLFGGDSDSESDENVDENNLNNLMSEQIDAEELNQDNLKQYKINLKTPRNVSHRTEVTLDDRIENILNIVKQQQINVQVEQKVSVDFGGLVKTTPIVQNKKRKIVKKVEEENKMEVEQPPMKIAKEEQEKKKKKKSKKEEVLSSGEEIEQPERKKSKKKKKEKKRRSPSTSSSSEDEGEVRHSRSRKMSRSPGLPKAYNMAERNDDNNEGYDKKNYDNYKRDASYSRSRSRSRSRDNDRRHDVDHHGYHGNNRNYHNNKHNNYHGNNYHHQSRSYIENRNYIKNDYKTNDRYYERRERSRDRSITQSPLRTQQRNERSDSREERSKSRDRREVFITKDIENNNDNTLVVSKVVSTVKMTTPDSEIKETKPQQKQLTPEEEAANQEKLKKMEQKWGHDLYEEQVVTQDN